MCWISKARKLRYQSMISARNHSLVVYRWQLELSSLELLSITFSYIAVVILIVLPPRVHRPLTKVIVSDSLDIRVFELPFYQHELLFHRQLSYLNDNIYSISAVIALCNIYLFMARKEVWHTVTAMIEITLAMSRTFSLNNNLHIRC